MSCTPWQWWEQLLAASSSTPWRAVLQNTESVFLSRSPHHLSTSSLQKIDSPLKYQHRCICIFKEKQGLPTGFALGSIEGRVAIHYANPPNPLANSLFFQPSPLQCLSSRAKDNFTFKCHRSAVTGAGQTQDIFAVCFPSRPSSPPSPLLQVNCIAFHPVHNTLATVGSDGKFSFWDKDARTKLKTSEAIDQPVSSCAFNFNGNIFAYAVSYDWSKVSVSCSEWHLMLVCHLPRVTSTTPLRRRMPSSSDQCRKR